MQTARVMDACNGAMTDAAIGALPACTVGRLLEIGPGCCGHLLRLLALRPGTVYFGLEISEEMAREAVRLHAGAVAQGRASFTLYDGLHIPFPDDYFDCGLTVNTIYFWDEALAREIFRVLKPGGRFCITFSLPGYMSTLPFASFGFRLRDADDAARLVTAAGFTVAAVIPGSDIVCDKAGNPARRDFITLAAEK